MKTKITLGQHPLWYLAGVSIRARFFNGDMHEAADVQHAESEKPRLHMHPLFKGWVCKTPGVIARGATPAEAYQNWLTVRRLKFTP